MFYTMQESLTRFDPYLPNRKDNMDFNQKRLEAFKYFNNLGIDFQDLAKEYTEGFYGKTMEQKLNDSYQDGFDVGYDEGETDGIGQGYKEGYKEGYCDGYDAGKHNRPKLW